ncbi:DUF6114 domain-containing protein [Saccharothrix xinjiangensis]|uniref:DUF6114 domain-containing protein n=1 Tax=Saccharothrix xinjiangensis TaxID=204798 RepID=A0ABV9XZV6_9PSEU
MVVPIRRGRVRLRRWRRGRPFGAGLFLLAGAVPVMAPPYATFRLGDALISVQTVGGVSALLVGALLLVCGLSLWVRPGYRVAAGVTAVLLSLVALVTSNLGGFLVGSLCGLVGGALAVSWTDRPHERRHWWSWALVLVAVLVVHPAEAAPRVPPSGEPWTLTAEEVGLDGLAYAGVVETSVAGRVTRALRFTAHSARVTGMVQVVPTTGGRSVVLRATAARFGGGVELLVLRVTATVSLLGLVGLPVDFTPERPPPLVLPSIVLTDVRTVNAPARGAALTVAGAVLEVR